MSPATNGKSASPTAGVKRRASSSQAAAKKRAKKGTSSKEQGLEDKWLSSRRSRLQTRRLGNHELVQVLLMYLNPFHSLPPDTG